METKRRFERIKNIFVKRSYLLIFIISFISYVLFNIYINKLYITYTTLFLNLKFGTAFVGVSLVVSLLIATNVSLVIMRFREMKMLGILGKQGGVTGIGVFGGLLGGACPGCFAGVFPAFLGLFGATVTLNILPLYGLEIQLLSAVILLISTFYLTKDITCRVKIPRR
ncbi:hypothetical protein HYT23_06960 [Candidatus Pacearchaeota archaeon]|nr:hypothetical protein [Candidatus Pacearchaeota archaeon]